MNKLCQERLVAAWYERAWWLLLLRPLEAVFRLIAAVRRQAYARGVLSRYRAPRPVIVVGNISVGGTGKTPTVIALVNALTERGMTAGVVCRGYGASAGEFPHWVDEHSSVAQCGDEALLIYRRTRSPCVVAPSRQVAIECLLEQCNVDVIICDDGLQHYALARDLEIVMYDSAVAYGNGYCLPAGPLREPLSRLGSVDFVLARGGSDPGASVQYHSDYLVHLQSQECLDFSSSAIERSVYAVAGVGQPQMFMAELAGAGFTVEQRLFRDHHAYCAKDFEAMCDKPVIMTEKDAVKCATLAGDNAWYLQISATLPERVIESVVKLAQCQHP